MPFTRLLVLLIEHRNNENEDRRDAALAHPLVDMICGKSPPQQKEMLQLPRRNRNAKNAPKDVVAA
jgi:hypothetical protein